ncbi:MAG TPA: hypothetical protein VKK61_08780, partial [Tepidisphaeraceae bacterium]|nr:hypothetical protein [Tepidisphaeraceae bacterium]
LFLCSFPIYWITQRKKLPLRPIFFLQQIVGVILFLGIISPMIICNQRHGWPMLAHTLGHLGVGGDQAGRINRGNAIVWLASTLGGILGAIGPACIALMIWTCWHAFRARRENSTRWQDRLWLMCAAWPSILFFVFLSFIKPVVPSWPLPSFVPLVALLADVLVSEFDQRMRNSKSAVSLRRGWNALIIYGIGGWLVLSFPTVLSHLPVVGARFEKSIIRRFTGHREAAAELRSVLENLKTPDGRAPLVVTRHYMQAALDCFYLPDHPVIYTAGKYLGKRSTTFDQWPDTNLENPALYGRTLLLDGEGDIPWERALIFDKREPVTNEYFIAANYRGPQPNYLGSNGEPTDE